jgi:serine/threonine protein phosphatase PrpC
VQIYSGGGNEIYSVSLTQGYRNSMEDEYVAEIDENAKQACFCVFDGHGGKHCSAFLKSHLPSVLYKKIKEVAPNNYEQAIKTTFKDVNDATLLDESVGWTEGSTALVAFIKNDVLFVANAGDCRAVVWSNGTAIQLSTDHRPGKVQEYDRILNLGGCLRKDNYGEIRICSILGSLSVSRSFGDWYLAKYLVPVPSIMRRVLTDKDEILILACDGVWDYMKDNQEAFACIKKCEQMKERSNKLIEYALDKKSGDNITVIIIDLQMLRQKLN